MDGKPNGFTYNAAPEPNDIGFDKGTFFYFHEKSCWTMAEPFPIFFLKKFDKGTIEDQAILGELKRSNSERASAFTSFIESNKQVNT